MSEIITVNLAETVGNGRAVHVTEEGDVYNAVLPSRPATGVCLTGGDATDAVQVFISGTIPAPIEGAGGAVVYLDNTTPGQITAERPNGASQTLGKLSDGARMIVNIDQFTPQINPAAAKFFL